MKKTTEKKALRNITDIRTELETRVNAYNAAINADDTRRQSSKSSTMKHQSLKKSMPAPRFMQRRLNCSTVPRLCLRRQRL